MYAITFLIDFVIVFPNTRKMSDMVFHHAVCSKLKTINTLKQQAQEETLA